MGNLSVVEFLEARIAEDEERARDFEYETAMALNGSYSNYDAHYGAPASWSVLKRIGFTPARVLAECAAKRAIIGMHRRLPDAYDDAMGDTCTMCTESGPEAQSWPCSTLKALAAVYRDHPDHAKVFPNLPQTSPAT